MKYKNYIYLILLLFIASINFNLFLKPNYIVCGGTAGLAIIINKICNIDYFVIILVINILMFLLSKIFLNNKITLSLIISTFVYPLFVKLTSNLVFSFNLFILNITISGIISGLTNGFIYKIGFSSGGINILGPLLNKYFHIKIGSINIIINIVIMIFNLLLFGFNNLIYSCLIIIINGIVINIVLYKKILVKLLVFKK